MLHCLLLQTHKAVCPSTFVLGPELALTDMADPEATAKQLGSWTDGLNALFSRRCRRWVALHLASECVWRRARLCLQWAPFKVFAGCLQSLRNKSSSSWLRRRMSIEYAAC
jgi:hypothetical protein